jgi:pSer/pThr/pTyr-binding forkhead associated (FHA) protein
MGSQSHVGLLGYRCQLDANDARLSNRGKKRSLTRVNINKRQAFNGIGGKMARLILISEGVDFATHEFVGDIVFIGRTQSNQIVIDHPTVSAQHALLLRVGDSYRLTDLNSANGTQINGAFVTEAELKDGDTIQFGSVIAVFEEGCRKPWSSRGTKMFGMNTI